jgi:hypothetical protein
VTERSRQLAAKAERQLSGTVEFLTGLADSDLQAPCDDEQGGGTVGSLATHLTQGYNQASTFLRLRKFAAMHGNGSGGGISAALGTGHGMFGGHGHAFAHAHSAQDTLSLEDMIARLKRDGKSVIEMLEALNDEELSSVPPAIGNIADGHKTLGQVTNDIIDHQAVHLENLKKAIARQPESVKDA